MSRFYSIILILCGYRSTAAKLEIFPYTPQQEKQQRAQDGSYHNITTATDNSARVNGLQRANMLLPSLLSSSRRWDLGFWKLTWLCQRIHQEQYWEMVTVHLESMEHLRRLAWEVWHLGLMMDLPFPPPLLNDVRFSHSINTLNNILKYTAHWLALSALDEYYIRHNEHNWTFGCNLSVHGLTNSVFVVSSAILAKT
jgi:hypothetical protein